MICFFGERLLKIILGIAGFMTGSALGALLAFYIVGPGILLLIIAVLTGIICAIFFIFMFYGALFILGAVLGGLIGLALSGIIGLDGGATAVAVGILAIVIGITALIFHKSMIRGITAFYGAAMAASGTCLLITSNSDIVEFVKDPASIGDATLQSIIILLMTFLLGLTGTLYQMGLIGHRD